MKQKKLEKKIMTIYINKEKSPKVKRKNNIFPNDTSNYLITKYELISQILNQKMNLTCFDCRKKAPKYISINNSIFLCPNCAFVHKENFPEKISFIIENNLNLLSINYLRLLFIGGNQSLDNFINYVFPGLQNYPPKILYRTQALIYYRDNLKYKIKEGPEPICPNEFMAYKIASEKGLVNIRDKTIFYNDLEMSLDKNLEKTYREINASNNNNDIINNYYNNFNNTYNTYNSFSVTENNQEQEKEKLGSSLSNKEFFNEMKNLFGKRYVKNVKKSFNSYKKLISINSSFNDFSKLKSSKKNNLKEYINKPLTFRLNESLNYSFSKAKEKNKNSLKTLNLNLLNKSTISTMRDKTPKNLRNNIPITHRYTKPNIKIIKKNNGINVKYIENGKLKEIYNNKNKFNNIMQQNNVLKYFKIQKKAKSSLKNNKDNIITKNNTNVDINKITNISKNKSIGLNTHYSKTILKEKIMQNINKIKNKHLYINTDFMNKSNDVSLHNNNCEKNVNYNCINIYNNYNKQKKILIKKNNMNMSFDGFNKRRPIRVNRKIYLENKNKALKDKKEKEALNSNFLFDNKDNYNDIFTNIISLSNSYRK